MPELTKVWCTLNVQGFWEPRREVPPVGTVSTIVQVPLVKAMQWNDVYRRFLAAQQEMEAVMNVQAEERQSNG